LAKLLFIVGVTILIVYLFKGRRKRADGAPRPSGKPAEDMARCVVCGVNLPRSEALLSKGRIYCCEEHLRQDR
jgi:uncharacterized protein